MNNCMVDLETQGTVPGSIILSIGAVFFSASEGLGEKFHVVINKDSAQSVGLKADKSTLEWWDKQSHEAKATVRAAESADSTPIQSALVEFNTWLKKHSEIGKLKLWGNGADFDQPILVGAYRACSIEPAWKFYNNRCYRTLKNLFPAVPLVRQGTYHNAIDDAITQADHAISIVRAVTGVPV